MLGAAFLMDTCARALGDFIKFQMILWHMQDCTLLASGLLDLC